MKRRPTQQPKLKAPIIKTIVAISLGATSKAEAIVNMWSGNLSETHIDLELSPSRLTMKRTYNSRSLNDGMFGFGWCTEFEAKLLPIADGGMKLRNCETQMEMSFRPLSPTDWIHEASGSLLKKKNGEIEWRMQDATTLSFDSDGNLLRVKYPNQEFLMITRNRVGRIERISSSKGGAVKLAHDPATGKVARVEAEGGRKIHYRYKDGNLTEAADEAASLFSYRYDVFRNLNRVDYPDATFDAITYDDSQDRVTRIRTRNSCIETYRYEASATDPARKFTSTAQKTCRGELVASSKHEFWHRIDSDGRIYLSQARVTEGKNVMTAQYPAVQEPRQKRSMASELSPRIERRQ